MAFNTTFNYIVGVSFIGEGNAMLICPTREVWWWHITFHKTRKVFPIQRTFNLLSCSWRGVLDTTLCDHVCQWLAAGRWFSLIEPITEKWYQYIKLYIYLLISFFISRLKQESVYCVNWRTFNAHMKSLRNK
jgi:hypothetical protein